MSPINNSIDADYIVERFTLDVNKLPEMVELIRQGFGGQPGSQSFDAPTFNIMFGSPYVEKDLFVRVIHKPTGKIVGFTGVIPRDLVYKDFRYRMGMPTWQVVHEQHRRKGLAEKMNEKLLDYSKEKGFQGAIGTYELGRNGLKAAMATARIRGIHLQDACTVEKVCVRIIDMKGIDKVQHLKWFEKMGLGLIQKQPSMPTNKQVRKFQPKDAERLFELMGDYAKHNQISTVREKQDFLWYLQQPGINCIVHENSQGNVDGFILAWKMMLEGYGNLVPFGWLDLIHVYNLSLQDAADMAKMLCFTAKELGWAGIQMAYVPYFDAKILRKAGFILYPKKMFIKIWHLEKLELPDPIESLYVDWR